jgi:hypothetical protein
MNLFLDTEFDGHGGELISLALAAEDGDHWYGSFLQPMYPQPWVAEHVIPVIDALPPRVRGPACFASLRQYLVNRPGAVIWADWPGDFRHLMALMEGPSYAESLMIPCTMQLIETPPGEPKPEIPHNALSDAIALMKWHQSLKVAA